MFLPMTRFCHFHHPICIERDVEGVNDIMKEASDIRKFSQWISMYHVAAKDTIARPEGLFDEEEICPWYRIAVSQKSMSR
jgi:hypothetical protein